MNDIDDVSYDKGYSEGYCAGSDAGWQNGYNSGCEDTKAELNEEFECKLYDKDQEIEDKLSSQEFEFEERIQRLADHLCIKDAEIETYLTEIYELRKANEELQRSIKKNS